MRNYPELIANAEAEIQQHQRIKQDLIKEWIEADHPLKVGDVVECNSYSFTGEKIIVTYLTVKRQWDDGWEWQAEGSVLKQDGTPGKQIGMWRQPVKGDA